MFCCTLKKKNKKPLTKPKNQRLNLIYQDGVYFDRNLKIITEYNRTNFNDTADKDCRYFCPICFKYFDCMLNSTCCNNYICHLCAMQSISNKLYNCHYCRNEECKYIDVDPRSQVKIYTDSHTNLP